MGNPNTQRIGNIAEDQACAYLEKQGMICLDRNYYCDFGEIDLIMKEGEYIVFAEVRCRNNQDYASALESVTLAKQHKLIKTATFYLLENKLLNKVDCRFDVLAVAYTQVDWIKNAFSVDR